MNWNEYLKQNNLRENINLKSKEKIDNPLKEIENHIEITKKMYTISPKNKNLKNELNYPINNLKENTIKNKK